MFEFMKNAFFALVGVVCTGAAATVVMLVINVIVLTSRRMKNGGK